MKKNNEIWSELRALKSPLADLSNEMPFEVPAGYFETLSKELYEINQVANEADPNPNWSKSVPYSTPDGYFEGLTQELYLLAAADHVSTGIPVPYEVEPGYIQALPKNLLNHAKRKDRQKNRTRIIQFIVEARKTGVRWAAAAVVVLSLGLGSYEFHQFHSADAVADRALHQVETEELGSYVNQHLDEFDSESLETAVATSNGNLTNTLPGMDEQEIQEYLNQNGTTNLKQD